MAAREDCSASGAARGRAAGRRAGTAGSPRRLEPPATPPLKVVEGAQTARRRGRRRYHRGGDTCMAAAEIINKKWYIRTMSLRPFASGMVSFGLVTIPVKLYSTGETAVGVQFNMLHAKCGSRLKQQYVCPTDDAVVEPRMKWVKRLRIRQGPIRSLQRGRAESAQPRSDQRHRHLRVRAARAGRSHLFRKVLLPGPGQGWRAPLPAARRSHERSRPRAPPWRGMRRAAVTSSCCCGRSKAASSCSSCAAPRRAAPLLGELPGGRRRAALARLKLATQIIEQIATDRFAPETYEDEVRQPDPRSHRKEGGRPGHHHGAGRSSQGADHRSHGGAQGQPQVAGHRRSGAHWPPPARAPRGRHRSRLPRRPTAPPRWPRWPHRPRQQPR